MKVVEIGRKWIICTAEEYKRAMTELDGSEFLANMTENFRQYQTETAEIRRQRSDVMAQAVVLGIA